MTKCKSFSYCINEESKILILGSMPGVKSLEMQQYYAHPQNRFWKVLGTICDCENLYNMKYEARIQILLNNGIALWDVLGLCEREGSLDSNIEKEVPNKIPQLLKKYPNITKICLNGNKSYSVFKKYFPKLLMKYDCYKLPSTSPANARLRLEDLLVEWGNALKA